MERLRAGGIVAKSVVQSTSGNGDYPTLSRAKSSSYWTEFVAAASYRFPYDT
jgi:hypothetical protein